MTSKPDHNLAVRLKKAMRRAGHRPLPGPLRYEDPEGRSIIRVECALCRRIGEAIVRPGTVRGAAVYRKCEDPS